MLNNPIGYNHIGLQGQGQGLQSGNKILPPRQLTIT